MEYIVTVNGKKLIDTRFLRSVMYGEGVFETFRYRGRLPKHIDQHYKRLTKGAELLKIPKITREDYIFYIEETVKKCKESDDLYVKTVLLSEGNIYFPVVPYKSHLLVIVKPYKEPEKKEISLTVAPFRVHSSDPMLRIKSTSYSRNIIAKRYALEKGCDDVLFLNENGEVTETSSANIFWIKGRFLYTPSVDCGLLPGVTRNVILKKAKDEGFAVVEGRFYLEDVRKADFIFVANALNGIIRVSKIEIL
ncbi:aminotransferase class IV [Persephonella sp.]